MAAASELDRLPLVSVVVPTHNRRAALQRLLDSLRRQTYPVLRFEVIVVDDGSTDDTQSFLHAYSLGEAPLRCLRQSNLGPAAARNLGFRAAVGQIIAFIDDDAEADPDWLAKGVQYFASDSIAGVEGAVIARNDHPATPLDHVVQNLNGGSFITCNIFYRRDVLERFGGFDRRFMAPGMPYVREDSDLAFTVLEAGYSIVFAQDARVFHPVIGKTAKYLLKVETYGFYEPLIRAKHPGLFRSPAKYGLARRKVGFLVQPWYWGYYLSLPAVTAGLFSLPHLAQAVILLLLASYSANLFHRFRRSPKTIFRYPMVLPLLLIAPYLRLYWTVRGIAYASKCMGQAAHRTLR